MFEGDTEKKRRTGLLHYVSILLIFFCLAIFIVNWIWGSQNPAALNWILGIVLLTQLIVQKMIRSGYEMVAGYILIFLGWSAVTAMARHFDGVYDVSMLGYIAIILGTGYFFGWKGSAALTLASIGAIWWLASLQFNGLITPSLAKNPYRAALDLTINFIVNALIIFVLLRTLTRALQKSQHELVERCRVEIELEKSIVKLSDEIAERKQIQVELQRQAITDFLTGLFNRRYFFEVAQKEFAKAARYDRFISVIIFDIDRFKDINDTYGHDIGDQALIEIGSLLRSTIRNIDISARYGGEEFVILLPEMNCASAEVAAERLRKKVEDTLIQVEDNLVKLTISAGVAGKNGDHQDVESIDQLISRADKALYAAKQAGRNKVVCYQG